MRRTLPLYSEAPALEVERADARAVDSTCRRCALSEGVRSACLPAEGDPGGLLVVGDFPLVEDDRRGVPFASQTGAWVRQAVARSWSGPVVYDYALRCAPGARKLPAAAYAECRGYLRKTLADARPTRVVLMGNDAMKVFLGRGFHTPSLTRAYTYTAAHPRVPVYLLPAPGLVIRNRYLSDRFLADLAWALTGAAPASAPDDGIVSYADDAEQTAQALAYLAGRGRVVWDTETFGAPHDREFRLLTLSAGVPGEPDAFVWDEAARARPGVREALRAFFERRDLAWVGQNLKFDRHAVRMDFGADVGPLATDTRLLRKLADATAHTGLENLQTMVGMGGGKDEMAAELDQAILNLRATIANRQGGTTPSGRPRKPKVVVPLGLTPEVEAVMFDRLVTHDHEPERYAFGLVDPFVREVYCARDVVSTGLLEAPLLEGVRRRDPDGDLMRLWETVVRPMEYAISQMEWTGIRVSSEALTQLYVALSSDIDSLYTQLRPYVWEGFNPSASSNDTGRLLFGDAAEGGLGLRPKRFTPSGKPGTALSDIEAIDHPVVPLVLRLRKALHFRSTYVDSPRAHRRDDGRIHTSYKLDGTTTGRPSTESPNLLNVPRPTSPEGKLCRDVFISDDGYQLVEGDYNQIELRVAALLSGDSKMISTFASGADFHLATAKMIAPYFKVDPNSVTKEHPLRSRAKIVNFGTLYGKDEYGLAAELGISKAEARRLIDTILGQFRQLAAWIQAQLTEGRRRGYTRTWWAGRPARFRPLPELASHNDDERATAERSTWNTSIQGTAAEFTNASLGAIQRWLDESRFPARLVLTVYDSIVAEVRQDLVPEYVGQVNAIMTSWESNGVPIKADFKAGYAWGSLEEVHV